MRLETGSTHTHAYFSNGMRKNPKQPVAMERRFRLGVSDKEKGATPERSLFAIRLAGAMQEGCA